MSLFPSTYIAAVARDARRFYTALAGAAGLAAACPCFVCVESSAEGSCCTSPGAIHKSVDLLDSMAEGGKCYPEGGA